MELNFRTLHPDEIDCRVQQVAKGGKGCILLLYKDARADMNLLDETVGCMNWQRSHEFKDGKLYCMVSIFDGEKNGWVSKEDVGTESNTEQEKGQASDSFKRACVNWGCGRELYTSPFTYINLNDGESFQKGDKYYLSQNVKFHVKEIDYDDKRNITKLVIVDNQGEIRFTFPKKNVQGKDESPKRSSYKAKEEKVPDEPKKDPLIPNGRNSDNQESIGFTREDLTRYYKMGEIYQKAINGIVKGRKFEQLTEDDKIMLSFTLETIKIDNDKSNLPYPEVK